MTDIQTNLTTEHELEEKYYIVKNAEEQYSIWPSYKQIPNGWQTIESESESEPKPKSECLAYIEDVWTDMRPLSLKKQMERISQEQNNTRSE